MLKKNNKNFKGRAKLPTKRRVNLAAAGYKKISVKIMIPAIAAIILAAALFSKIAVVDRLQAVNEAQAQAANMQTQLDEAKAEIDSFGELTTEYAHYTFSDFTEEELDRADRLEAIDLIGSIVLPAAGVSSWSITGNEISLTATGSSLEKLNTIAAALEKDARVDFCVVKTASTQDDRSENSDEVVGQMTIYLLGAQEGGTENESIEP